MLLCSTGHGHDFMRNANWFSSLAAFACCCLLLLADQALLQAVGGVVGACWCRLVELLVPVGGWSCWCCCSCVKSEECFRFGRSAASAAIVDCSTIDNRTLDCSTIDDRTLDCGRLFDNRELIVDCSTIKCSIVDFDRHVCSSCEKVNIHCIIMPFLCMRVQKK